MRTSIVRSDEAIVAAIDALNASRVAYMVTGGLAANFYTTPRSTNDADFIIALGDASIMDVARHLPSDFVLDPQMTFETATNTFRYVAQPKRGGFKLEFFLLTDDEYDQTRFSRRIPATVAGKPSFVASAEDVVVFKLRWLQRVNRGKDRMDVGNVIAMQGSALDWPYIHGWCENHGTTDLLNAIIAEADASKPYIAE